MKYVFRIMMSGVILLSILSAYAQQTPESASAPPPAAVKPDCSGIALPPPAIKPSPRPSSDGVQTPEQQKGQSDALCAQYRAACGMEHPACVKY